jgi:molybdate transport system substrate-binding protein
MAHALRKNTGVLLLLPLLLGVTASCRRQSPSPEGRPAGPIVVSAAISLKEAFLKVASLYTAQTGVKVDFSFGASGELLRQIEAGAPVDVFASAGEHEMDELASKGLADPATRANFARNVLVLVVPRGAGSIPKSFSNLAHPTFKRIAIGDPKTVPAGEYSRQLLQNLGMWTRLRPRLIYAENVRQVLDYVARGEVNAGLVYRTDVPIAHGRVTLAAQAPDGKYGPVLYPIAVVRGSPHAVAGGSFVKLVLSTEGQKILGQFGFLPVQ